MSAPGRWDEGADPALRYLDAAQAADDALLDADTQRRLDDLDWATVTLTDRGAEVLGLTGQVEELRAERDAALSAVDWLSGRRRAEWVLAACAVVSMVAWVLFLLAISTGATSR